MKTAPNREVQRRDTMLSLWASGVPTDLIAKRVGYTADTVRRLVSKARERGDERAVRRESAHSNRGKVPPTVSQKAPKRVIPSWEGMSIVGLLMGDPQPGRSALDRKRAGLPV